MVGVRGWWWEERVMVGGESDGWREMVMVGVRGWWWEERVMVGGESDGWREMVMVGGEGDGGRGVGEGERGVGEGERERGIANDVKVPNSSIHSVGKALSGKGSRKGP